MPKPEFLVEAAKLSAELALIALQPEALVQVCLPDEYDGDLRIECMKMITQLNRLSSFTKEASEQHEEMASVGFSLRIVQY
jgi:hypothetical protein